MIFLDIGNLKIKPKFILLCLFLSIVTLTGCLGNLQTTTSETQTKTGEATTSNAETETPRALAELQISTPKTNYTANEAIPLELNIQNGKFDLFVPFFSVASRGAFTQITVNDANRQIVKPKRAITQEHPQKYVSRDGKTVRCIQGFELKASANQELKLKDIQKYYQLQPGTYTITLSIELEVYTESITEEHPEINELRQDMARIQKDPNLQGAAKQDALSYYQEQIKFIQDRQKDAVQNIYLPVKSLRGKASLVSNSITVTVEQEMEAPTGQIQDETPSEINKSDTASPKKPLELKDLVARRADEWVAPKYKTKVDAKYPKSAKEAEKAGRVTLQVTIDENGTPQDIVALTNLGFGLEEAAIEALKKSTFHPAMKGGKPISIQVKIPFSFAIANAN